MERKSPARANSGSYALPVATAAAAIAIFILDAITQLEIAGPVLYVAVVLMSARFLRARGLLLIALACVVLAVLNHLMTRHGEFSSTALANLSISIAAIGVTAYLGLLTQSAELTLKKQARLLDVTHDAIFVRDRNEVIIYWNRGAEKLYGWTTQEAVGRVSHELLQTVFPAPLEDLTATMLGTGRWEGELLHTTRDGIKVDAASRWSLQRDERGQPVAILETNNDITLRNRADAELQRSEQRYRHIFESTGVSIWEEDFAKVKAAIDALRAQGVEDFRRYLAEHPQFVQQAIAMVKVVDVNHATLKLFGARSKGELLESLHNVFKAETQEVFALELIAIAEEQSSFESEVVLQTLNGDRLDVIITMTLPFESGKFDSVLVSITDITARKQAQEALQEAQAELFHISRVTTLGELAASIAHEVNQPLAAVGANAAAALRWLAAQPPDLEEVQEALRRIANDGYRAGEIIKRVRALAKKAPHQKEPLHINDVLGEVISLTRTEVHKHGVVLQTSLAGDLPLIAGDRVQLNQVVTNLIVNALEAMSASRDGRRELVIRTWQDGSNEVLVAVQDSGPGLEEESAVRVFDAFYTTKSNGIGMGLAISRSIITAHGGRLWAMPNVPRGAVFQFALPLYREAGS